MISVIFGDPRGSLSCGLTNKNGTFLWSKRSSDRQGRSFFLFKEEVFYGDTWFVSRKIESDAFDSSNAGLERVDEDFFGGEYSERDWWISVYYTGFVGARWGNEWGVR